MQCSTSPLGVWLKVNGGAFHDSLIYQQDSYGTSIFTSTPLPSSTSVVSCPFSLAVTPSLSYLYLNGSNLFPTPLPTMLDHALMILYLALHLILDPSEETSLLNLDQSEAKGTKRTRTRLEHRPYMESLPKISEMRTPLYFNHAERELLKGTNLWGATIDRENTWRVEWEGLKGKMSWEGRDKLTWEIFLYCCTILSSRAFPSSLLPSTIRASPNGPLEEEPTGDDLSEWEDRAEERAAARAIALSTPILFPGVDTLNHRLGTKVSWFTDVGDQNGVLIGGEERVVDFSKEMGTLSIVLEESTSSNTQVYNTYGPKSSEELLLGYGFTNPGPSSPSASSRASAYSHEILALKVGLPPLEIDQYLPTLLRKKGLPTRYIVGSEGKIDSKLKTVIRLLCLDPNGKERFQIDMRMQCGEGRVSGCQDEEIDFISWENEMDMLDSLRSMLEMKMDNLRKGREGGVIQEGRIEGGLTVREDVRKMIEIYKDGQEYIMEQALAEIERTIDSTIEEAAQEGVDLMGEDCCDEDMNDEEDE